MKVIVFGATGQTGKIAVSKLLEAGHQVTAFARKPDKIAIKHEHLTLAQGDLANADSVEAAMKSQDTVFCAIAPGSLKYTGFFHTAALAILQAMTKQGVKRIVNLSAWGAGDSRAHSPFFFRAVIIPLILKKVFEDKEKGEEVLMASQLDWVNVRPGMLTNAPAKGGVKATLDPKGLKASMTRVDLADFMIAQLTSPEWVRKSPLIGY